MIFTTVWAIALNTLREVIRNKILYSILLFAAIIVGGSTIFSSVTVGDHIKVVKDFALFSLSFLGALVAMVSGVNLLNKELNQKTIYNILSKPVTRAEFVLGKQLGLTLTVWIILGLSGIAVVGFISIIEGRIDPLLFQAILFAMLESMIISAVTIFFSCIVITTVLTGLFTLATYIAGRSVAYLTYFVSGNEQSTPLQLLIKGCDLLLPDLARYHVADTIVYGQAIPLGYLVSCSLYALAYSTALWCISTLIFNHRELQ